MNNHCTINIIVAPLIVIKHFVSNQTQHTHRHNDVLSSTMRLPQAFHLWYQLLSPMCLIGEESPSKKQRTFPPLSSSSSEDSDSSNDNDLSDAQNAADPNAFSSEALPPEEKNQDTEQNNQDSFGTDDGFENPHGPEFDTAAERYSFVERMIHFSYPYICDANTRVAWERAIIIQAGTIIIDDKTMDTNSRNQLLVETYKGLVRSFPDSAFSSPELKEKMVSKLYNAKTELNGKQLWDKFKEVRNDLRTNYNIKDDIPSGKRLRDVYNSFMAKKFAEDNVSI